jgi:serine protease AprX
MFTLITRAQPRLALFALGAAACFLLDTVAPASAGPHRARVSEDLADHLAANSQTIRVIVHGDKAETDALALRYNVRVARTLKTGAVLLVNAGQLAAMRDDDAVDHLSGDVRLRSSVDAVTAETIGADQVWTGTDDVRPVSGRGVTVAVIDSGINAKHNALRGRVLLTRDFTGGDGVDRFGHGTHVAAIIAGQTGRTAETREYRGIAPGAYLLNLRVLGDDGSGLASDVIEAIDWTIEHRREFNVRIINLSLGAPVMQPYRDDPLCEAVERAYRAGIVVVAAAGNYGRTADGKDVYGAIASPGNSPFAITVGAIDTHETAQRSDDTLAPYSSKGPTRYDLVMKPDVSAPGTRIVSAESAGGYLSVTYPARHVVGSGNNAYMQLSGTSMAAGVVSGAAALVLDARGQLTPRDTRAALQLTSTYLPSAGMVGAGAGLVNVLAAVELAETNRIPTISRIAGEDVVASGIVTQPLTAQRMAALAQAGKQLVSGTEIGRATAGTTIMWGDTVVWGNTIMWGDAILWGTSNGDTILWGSSNGDTILWGSSNGDTILWGSSNGDTILWGSSNGDTILWGSSNGDTILWGSSNGDTILWGSAY